MERFGEFHSVKLVGFKKIYVLSREVMILILVHYQDLNTVIKTHRKIMIPAVVELLVHVLLLHQWRLVLEPG